MLGGVTILQAAHEAKVLTRAWTAVKTTMQKAANALFGGERKVPAKLTAALQKPVVHACTYVLLTVHVE